MDKHVTESAVEFVKATTALGPPMGVVFFGLSLEEWMFIASIIASIFLVLDKLPSIVEKYTEKFKNKGRNSSINNSDADSSG